ncbi:hypothetical protein ABKV19_006100 [Rosa sericea]
MTAEIVDPDDYRKRYLDISIALFNLHDSAIKFVKRRISTPQVLRNKEDHDQRKRLVEEMKEAFTTSASYLEFNKLKEGLKGVEMSCMQWIKLKEFDEDIIVEEIKIQSISLGTRLSTSFACLLFMMMWEGKDQLIEKFQQLEFLFSFMAALEDGTGIEDSNSGIGVAYEMILPLFKIVDQEMKKEMNIDIDGKNSTSSWYESEQEINKVLDQFVLVLSTLDTLLGCPMLEERMLQLLGNGLTRLETRVNKFESMVNEIQGKFSINSTGLMAMDAFLVEHNTEQRWLDLIKSEGHSGERPEKRQMTGDISEEGTFRDAEQRLEICRATFEDQVKAVLKFADFKESNRTALDFGKFYVARVTSIHFYRKSDPAAPGRQEFLSEIRNPEWPSSVSRPYFERVTAMQGYNATRNRKSVRQLLEEHQPVPGTKLESLKAYAVHLGTQISKHLVKLILMLKSEGIPEMVLKIKNFESLFPFLLELFTCSGPAGYGVVYRKIITIISLADQELKTVQNLNQGNIADQVITNWYASMTEAEIDDILDDFAEIIATLESNLSFPLLLFGIASPNLFSLEKTHFLPVENDLNGVHDIEGVDDVVGMEEVVEGMEELYNDQKDTPTLVRQVLEKMKGPIEQVWEGLT